MNSAKNHSFKPKNFFPNFFVPRHFLIKGLVFDLQTMINFWDQKVDHFQYLKKESFYQKKYKNKKVIKFIFMTLLFLYIFGKKP